MARHESFLGSTLGRSAGASAGLSRQSCARQRHGAGAGSRGQPALAIAVRNRPVLRGALLGFASIVQTVPGLALLALFYPLLLALAALSLSWFGVGFSAFGFLPAVLALALYSMLPVLRNNHYRPWRRRYRHPRGRARRRHDAAAVVVHGGITTGAAGHDGGHPHLGGLGDRHRDTVDADRADQPRHYIFAGLQTQNWVFVLFGCLAAAVLALGVDQLLALIESGIRARRRLRVALGASASRRWSRRHWYPRWRVRHRAISSAPKPLPSNMCCRR